jgi:hypothetical protein
MTVDFSGCLAVLEQRGLLPEGLEAAFVVGSVARGWGNALSDYDIYLIAAKPWQSENATVIRLPLDEPALPTETVHHDGRRWEMKYWRDGQVNQMLAKVAWSEFDRGQASGQLLTDVEELFLERLATCAPLAGHEWIARRQADVERSAFRAFMVTRSLTESDGAVEDAIGQLDADDVESAVLSARKALGHAVDALLESHGQFGFHTPKWRARRFRAARQSVLSFEEYWARETMRGFDPDAPRHWVEETVAFCKNLAMEVEI